MPESQFETGIIRLFSLPDYKLLHTYQQDDDKRLFPIQFYLSSPLKHGQLEPNVLQILMRIKILYPLISMHSQRHSQIQSLNFSLQQVFF
jgi:hypothetical protein